MAFQNKKGIKWLSITKFNWIPFHVISKNNFLSLNNSFKMLCGGDLYKSGMKSRSDKRGTDLIAEKLKISI